MIRTTSLFAFRRTGLTFTRVVTELGQKAVIFCQEKQGLGDYFPIDADQTWEIGYRELGNPT